MKLDYDKMQTAYSIQARGSNGKFFDMVILIDTNRELTREDSNNIREIADKIQHTIQEQTIKLDPQSAIDAAKEKNDIINLFGNHMIFVKEIPNGYSDSYYLKHLPWFIVTTNKGHIKIGWRKRVLHIEWTDSVIQDQADDLFPEEDVTKYEKIIHAWGLEKAKEYIAKLLN